LSFHEHFNLELVCNQIVTSNVAKKAEEKQNATEHTNALFSKVMTLKSKIGCKSAFLDFSDIRTRERKKHRFHKTNRNSIDKKMDGKKDFFVFSIAGFTTEERFNIVHWNE
jgi:hypothetical protein